MPKAKTKKARASIAGEAVKRSRRRMCEAHPENRLPCWQCEQARRLAEEEAFERAIVGPAPEVLRTFVVDGGHTLELRIPPHLQKRTRRRR